MANCERDIATGVETSSFDVICALALRLVASIMLMAGTASIYLVHTAVAE